MLSLGNQKVNTVSNKISQSGARKSKYSQMPKLKRLILSIVNWIQGSNDLMNAGFI